MLKNTLNPLKGLKISTSSDYFGSFGGGGRSSPSTSGGLRDYMGSLNVGHHKTSLCQNVEEPLVRNSTISIAPKDIFVEDQLPRLLSDMKTLKNNMNFAIKNYGHQLNFFSSQIELLKVQMNFQATQLSFLTNQVSNLQSQTNVRQRYFETSMYGQYLNGENSF